MRWLIWLLLLLQPVWAVVPADSSQLVLVVSGDWDDVQGTMACYTRTPQGWRRDLGPWPVVVGRNGMAWGAGLHAGEAVKREGDGRAPAGVFSLLEFFGFGPTRPRGDLPYRKLTASMVGVDDPKSRFYNQIVESKGLAVDWESAEKMRIPDYELGIWVGHNVQPVVPGGGSCIFMHRWKDASTGTAGCTAMEPANLRVLCDWLRVKSKPVLVQLPQAGYERLKGDWNLP